MSGGQYPDNRPESFDLSGLAYTAATYDAAMIGDEIFYPLASALFRRDWRSESTPKDYGRFPWQADIDGAEVTIVVEGDCKTAPLVDAANNVTDPGEYVTSVTIGIAKSIDGPDRESILNDATRDILETLEYELAKEGHRTVAEQFEDSATEDEIYIPEELRKVWISYLELGRPEIREKLTVQLSKIYEYTSDGDTTIREFYMLNGLSTGLVENDTRITSDHYEDDNLLYTDGELYMLHRAIMAMPVNAAIAKALAVIRGQTTHTVSEEGTAK